MKTINFRNKRVEISVGKWDPKLGHYDLKRSDGVSEYGVRPPWYCWYTQKYDWGEWELYAELFRTHLQVSILDASSTKLQRRREK